MACDEELAERVRHELAGRTGVTEKRMFGGLAFLLGGRLAVAVSGQDGLMVRCDPADTESLVAEDGVESMVMRGAAMTGWIRVPADGDVDAAALERWVEVGTTYAAPLPPK